MCNMASKDTDLFLKVDEKLQLIVSNSSNNRNPCPYGSKCYRKNPNHLMKYYHPSKEEKMSREQNMSQALKNSPLVSKKSPLITSYFKRKKLNCNQEEIKKMNDNVNDSTTANISVIIDNKKLNHNLSSLSNKKYCSDESSCDLVVKGNNKNKTINDGDNYKIKDDSDEEEKMITRNNETIIQIEALKILTTKTTKKRYSKINLSIHDHLKPENKRNFSDNFNEVMFNEEKIFNKTDDMCNDITPMDIGFSSSKLISQETPIKNYFFDQKYIKDLHRKLFLTPIPDNVFLFWDFCKQISPKNPEDAFIEILDLKLVGPFDVLKGSLNEGHVGNENILTHWRYFYDPPEFQTFAIIKNDDLLKIDSVSPEYHLGFFRDVPNDDTPVVVSNDSKQSCEIIGEADNIFAAFYLHLRDKKFKSKDNGFKRKLNQMKNELKTFAQKNHIDLESTKKLRERSKKINALTLHRFGIVVDVINNVGYRELPENDINLKRLFKQIIDLNDDQKRRNSSALKKIYQIINLINYANDEKDFGMGLELGLDLFLAGHPFFHLSSEHLLCRAYEFLGREPFSQIIKSHLKNKNRNHYPNLSAFSRN